MLLASSCSHAFFAILAVRGYFEFLGILCFCVSGSVFLVLCFCVSVFLCFWFLPCSILVFTSGCVGDFHRKNTQKTTRVLALAAASLPLDDPKMYQRFCARGLILKAYHQHRARGHFGCSPGGCHGSLGGKKPSTPSVCHPYMLFTLSCWDTPRKVVEHGFGPERE